MEDWLYCDPVDGRSIVMLGTCISKGFGNTRDGGSGNVGALDLKIQDLVI